MRNRSYINTTRADSVRRGKRINNWTASGNRSVANQWCPARRYGMRHAQPTLVSFPQLPNLYPPEIDRVTFTLQADGAAAQGPPVYFFWG